MDYLLLVILLLISYILGSIPFALIVGKGMHKIDVRGFGSGNLGGTNTFRVLGKKAGVLVVLGDVLKGVIAASLPLMIGSDLDPFVVGLPAVLGHCYPIFAQFKGGKAIATSGGVLLVADPTLFLIMFVFFVILLARTKIVSLSSMVSAIILHGIMIWKGDTTVALATLVLLVLILYRHRENIARIVGNTEAKVNW